MSSRARELLLRAAPIMLRAMTPRWHLAQIVGHEGLGVCSWKRCSDDCVQARRLLLDLGDYLDGEGVTDE